LEEKMPATATLRLTERGKIAHILAYMFPIFFREEHKAETERKLNSIFDKQGAIEQQDLADIFADLYRREMSKLPGASGKDGERMMIYVGLAAVAMAAVAIGVIYYMM
jgi:hypothetical protein